MSTERGIDRDYEQKTSQDIDGDTRNQHEGTLPKSLANVRMRTLKLEEFGIGHGRDPGIALNSGMLAIERATVDKPYYRIDRERPRQTPAESRRREILDILNLNLDGDDGAPAIEQRAGILNVIQRQTKLLGNNLELDRTMTMNASEDLRAQGTSV